MRNMSVALLRHETIRTTLPKAKELRRVVVWHSLACAMRRS